MNKSNIWFSTIQLTVTKDSGYAQPAPPPASPVLPAQHAPLSEEDAVISVLAEKLNAAAHKRRELIEERRKNMARERQELTILATAAAAVAKKRQERKGEKEEGAKKKE